MGAAGFDLGEIEEPMVDDLPAAETPAEEAPAS